MKTLPSNVVITLSKGPLHVPLTRKTTKVSFEQDIERSVEVLRRGGVILYPTDTIWGLGCDATNSEAVARIFSIKQRPAIKSLIVLLADERDLFKYVANPDPAVFGFLESVSSPTTVIYDGAIGLAENLVSPDGTIAIRLVKEDFCRHLIKRFRKPLVSTSANISGATSPSLFKDIDSTIRDAVDYVVQFRQDDVTASNPSTIIRWQSSGSFTIIRP